ncbi:TPA: helix-turn-helix domain-containing protein [Streptococcus suis]
MTSNQVNLSNPILYKISHKEFTGNFHFPIHSHKLAELYLINQGSCHMNIANQDYQFKKGDCVILSPFVLHSLYLKDNENCDVIQIHFDLYHFPSCFVNHHSEPILSYQHFLNTAPSFYQPQLNNQERLFLSELSQTKEGDQLLHFQRELEFYLFLSKHLTQTKQLVKVEQSTKYQYVQSVMHYIELHYGNPITLETISKELNVSDHYLNKLFKSYTGTTIKHYLTLYRLNRSIEWMSESDRSLTFIAQEVGFHDLQHYSKTFQKYFNTSPRDFRQLLRKY